MKREFKDMVTYEPYDYLNSEITGDYDKAHAVKCINGTFVGNEDYGIATWLCSPCSNTTSSWTSSLLPDTLQISSPRASKAHSSAGDRGKLRERK